MENSYQIGGVCRSKTSHNIGLKHNFDETSEDINDFYDNNKNEIKCKIFYIM